MIKTTQPIGILLLAIGLYLVVVNQSNANSCSHTSFLYDTDLCRETRAYHTLGSIMIILGLPMFGVGAYLLVKENIEPDKVRHRCPRCREPITYQSSPLNCVNCGYRLDWSSEDNSKW